MTKRQRKPLDDSLASNFVFGEDKSVPEQPVAEEILDPPPTPSIESEEVHAIEDESTSIAPMTEEKAIVAQPNKESSLMDKLQVQSKEATKRFTVDLSESMHRKLSILAAKTGRTKADIVRLLLEDALEEVEE